MSDDYYLYGKHIILRDISGGFVCFGQNNLNYLKNLESQLCFKHNIVWHRNILLSLSLPCRTRTRLSFIRPLAALKAEMSFTCESIYEKGLARTSRISNYFFPPNVDFGNV